VSISEVKLSMRLPAARRACSALAIALGVGVACAGSPETAPAPPAAAAALLDARAGTPALWRAEGSELAPGSFYLFGSIHLGRPEIADLGAAVDAAYAASDEVVLEIDPAELDPAEVSEAFAAHGAIEPPHELVDVLTPETYDLLASHMADADLEMALIEHTQPWLIAMGIAQGRFAAQGLDEAYGVDRSIERRASAAARPTADGELAAGDAKTIVALETLKLQIETLSGLPYDVQDWLLRDTLQPDATDGWSTTAILAAWKRGDDERLREIFLEEPADPRAALYMERLIFERNERMTSRLVELAADGKSRFVAVGAAHMLGERGIPALLARRGFRIERIE
jgi:uncharacterized protein YbaP (TraB family)